MTATKLNGTNFFGMGDKDQLSKIMADVISTFYY